jgi:hypothetical protein
MSKCQESEPQAGAFLFIDPKAQRAIGQSQGADALTERTPAFGQPVSGCSRPSTCSRSDLSRSISMVTKQSALESTDNRT